jgi:hypothetical protein
MGAVGEKDIEPAVIVEIENSHPATHSLREILLRGRRVFEAKLETYGMRNVGERFLIADPP